jgi:PIN domain nuclease of toxin-antitoxin system
MNLLLDTHTFIWFLEGSDRLSINALEAIESEENTSFISIATLWEIAVKVSIGKLEMQVSFDELNTLAWENGIEILPIQFAHTKKISQLPFHHKDPFDRMIIAQSIV